VVKSEGDSARLSTRLRSARVLVGGVKRRAVEDRYVTEEALE
jgi:hypothetical protein